MANEKIEFDFTEIFKDERIGFLSTVHTETGAIQQNVVSWIHGYKSNVLRIAVGTKSQIVTNTVWALNYALDIRFLDGNQFRRAVASWIW